MSDINPEIPEEYIPIVERLMQKSPEARYPSMAEVIEALRSLTQPAAPVMTQRRPTMQMPRVKLGARADGLGAIGGIGGASPTAPPAKPGKEAPKPAARVNQPLPARAPSAPAARPSDLGRRAPEPAAVPAPARPMAPSRASASAPVRPAAPAQRPVAPRSVAPDVVDETAQSPDFYEEEAHAPTSTRSGVRFGPVAAVLIAVLAGAAAFFLSRMIPM